MIVENLLVYRIEPIDKNGDIHIGDSLPMPEENPEMKLPQRKKDAEDLFEEVRLSSFPDLLSRKRSLYVIPFEIEFVERWADTKYLKSFAEYLLLTLRLNGELEWYDADFFNDTVSPFPRYSNNELANHYWAGLGNDYSQTELVEGLFRGTAIIENIERKVHEALY